MAPHDEGLPHALGTGRADVVLAHDLQERGPHHAGGDGRVAIADRGCRPDGDGEVGDRVLPERHVADLGKPVEERQQRHDHEHAEPERGDGQPRDGHHPHDVIHPGVAIDRRDGAERNGDGNGDEPGHDGDLDRDRHTDGDFLRHRLARPKRLAEIERRQPRHVFEELLVERLVETEALAFGLDGLVGDRGAIRAQLHDHHVARHHADQEEHGDGDADQRRDRQEQAAQDVPDHGRVRGWRERRFWERAERGVDPRRRGDDAGKAARCVQISTGVTLGLLPRVQPDTRAPYQLCAGCSEHVRA